METAHLFPFSDYWWFYGAFLLFVFVILALDLGVFNRKAHEVSFKEATTWSIVWVVLALTVNGLFYLYAHSKFEETQPGLAKDLGLQFLTGYVLEYSLSVDNIFVFVLVFGYFGIPSKYKHRILFYGILGALIFRAIFIGIGSALMQIEWVIYIFGGFLIITGIKMLFSSDEEIEPEKNVLIKTFKRFVPVTHTIDGQKFFVKADGRNFATPLFIALLFLEATDIVFAVDSVPAIFAVTNEPLIVFTSNIMAILGLRSMFFMLEGVINKFHLLKVGLSVVLVFVGVKMAMPHAVWEYFFNVKKFPIHYSLAIIIGVLGISVAASLLFPRKEDPDTKKDESGKDEAEKDEISRPKDDVGI